MAIRQLVLLGLLAFATAHGRSAQGNRPQTPDEFRRMLAMGTKYRDSIWSSMQR